MPPGFWDLAGRLWLRLAWSHKVFSQSHLIGWSGRVVTRPDFKQKEEKAYVQQRSDAVAHRGGKDGGQPALSDRMRSYRASAARCRQEAADILKRCEPLLRKLSELEGLTYDSTILLALRNSQWTGSYITGAPIEECNPMEATAEFNAGYLVPRSRALRDQAKGVEAKALALEEREVLLDGSLNKPTLAAVFAEEHFTNPEIVAPAVHIVESWATSVEARIRRDRPELASREGHRSYRVVWSNGELQIGQCSISFPGVNYAAGDPTFTVGAAA